MDRKEFIRISSLAGIGLTTLPHLSFMAHFEEYTRNQLIGKGNPDIVGSSYNSRMHRETKIALNRMQKEAAKDNIKIEVVSAYRSFHRQKEIFERKYKQFVSQGHSPKNAIEKIIEYSTIPGTSRHHWGTDLDIIDANARRPKDVLLPENFHGNGPYCKLKMWLDIHAEKFDFIEVYTDNGNRKGFKYEPWHFSFAPISIPMLKTYQEKIDVMEMLSEERLLGSEHFSNDFVSMYINENILDINPKLLP